jgi:hypothetical protein
LVFCFPHGGEDGGGGGGFVYPFLLTVDSNADEKVDDDNGVARSKEKEVMHTVKPASSQAPRQIKVGDSVLSFSPNASGRFRK